MNLYISSIAKSTLKSLSAELYLGDLTLAWFRLDERASFVFTERSAESVLSTFLERHGADYDASKDCTVLLVDSYKIASIETSVDEHAT
ncbi:MAG: hypothetical protein ACLPI9_08790 [Halobacteriota archaeon]